MGQGLDKEEVEDMIKKERLKQDDAARVKASEAERRARVAQERVAQAEERAKTAALKEQEQARLARREAAQARHQAMEAQLEAQTQRERLLELEREVEDKMREEQKQKENFRWGPKMSHKWTEEECQKLVTNFKLTEDVENKAPKGHTFLLFGPTSHGKSSFANGCLAALENLDSPLMRHHVAQGEQSVSRKFSIQEYGPHRIIDMPGIFEAETITSDSIKMIVTGQIDWDSKITSNLEVADQRTAYDNTVECIIIIMKYDCDLPPQLKRQIAAIMEVCGEEDVSCHLVLTHLDVCDPQFNDTTNLPFICESRKALKAVQDMWEQTGIPANNISFVKNYTTETETDLNSNLQYLRILNFVEDTAQFIVKSRERKAKEELNQMKRQFTWGPKKPPEWSKEECERLTNKFEDKEEEEQVLKDGPRSAKLNKPKGHSFLLFGPTGHGKSSFGNGCLAALEDKDQVPTYHEVRQSEGSVTSQFSVYRYGPHKIIDMPGIFESEDVKSVDIRKIVTGQVPWISEMKTNLETKDEQQASGDTVECVIITLKYDCDLPHELRRQIKVILDLSRKGESSYHLVLTHLDVCDRQFKDTENLPNIYNSVKVLRAVERMSKETGIPPFNISFVKNYKDETETDLNSKLQYLRILDVAKEHADLVVEKKRTKEIMTQDYRKKNNFFPEGILSFSEVLVFLGVLFIAVLIVYLST